MEMIETIMEMVGISKFYIQRLKIRGKTASSQKERWMALGPFSSTTQTYVDLENGGFLCNNRDMFKSKMSRLKSPQEEGYPLQEII